MTPALHDYATLPLPLTTVEQETLHSYEATIERGLTTFYEVGAALMAIKSQKLYRAEFRTFEEYCQKKWNVGHSRAYQLIEAAGIRENLSTTVDESSTTVDVLPANEHQARALSGLQPEQQRQVWQMAVDTAPGGKVTAQHIKDIRQTEIPMPKPETKPEAAPVKQIHIYMPDKQPRPKTALEQHFEELNQRDPVDYALHAELEADDDTPADRETESAEHAARDLGTDNAFHFMHQDRARICAAGLTVLRVDRYKRILFVYDPQQGGTWKPRLKCKNDEEMVDAIQRLSDEPNTIFENRI